MKIQTTNEWSKLKSVIVGVADHAVIPDLDISLRTVNYADVKDESTISTGPYSSQLIEEHNQDLDNLAKFLSNESIEVIRPDRVPTNYYHCCPRDTVLTYNDTAVATPMSIQKRDHEHQHYSHYFDKLHIMPNNLDDDNYNLNCVGDPEQLALNEIYPKFDAANVIKANDHLLYLVSNSGNKLGAEKLQELFPDSKVHVLEGVYSYMHIDSTVAFLREGLMLLNPSRIKSVDQLPEHFRNWDVIWCPDPIDIGYAEGYNHASPWISMNLLSLNENLVILEERQEPLRRELEKHGIESAMLPFRHARTMGGCFHCATLDLVRE